MKKKIAIVMSSMGMGGTEKVLIDFLNVLDYEKYMVVIYLEDDNGKLQDQININTIIKYWENDRQNIGESLIQQIKNFEVVHVLTGIYNRLMTRKYRNFWELGNWYSRRCLPLLDTQQYDCAIAFSEIYIDVVANVLYCIRAKKKILWVHGMWERPENTVKHQAYEYSKFDRICCVSKTVQQWLSEVYPKLKEKTKVIHNFVNVQNIMQQAEEPINESMGERTFLTVGRLEDEKGQDMIPKIARILLDKGYDFTWYLIGDGHLENIVKNEIERYNVEKQVVLLGAKINPYPYMKKCDIYVQPSLSEGWGMTVQEAKILEKPIVVTPEPAFLEQIRDGENGLIAKEKTPEALSDGIVTLLEQPELKEKFSKNLQNEKNGKYGNYEELQELYDFIDD